ncbi:MAG: DUF1616 domain-containing protein [Candidatus Jordarchaeaceae archaeon]
MVANSKQASCEQTIIKIVKEKKPKTVEQLVNLAEGSLQISRQEIIETILRLQSERKLEILKQKVPSSLKLTTYLKSEQAIWYWATTLIALAAAISVLAIPEGLYPWAYIRYLLGAIFVLWLPGYSFTRAIFPTKLQSNISSIDNIERIALSIVMSLALVAIVGFILNYTPWGVRLTPIVLSLLLLTVAFSTVAIRRE